MQDAISNEPAPDYSCCAQEIVYEVLKAKNLSFNLNENLLKVKARRFIEKIPHHSLGSLMGWIVFSKKKYTLEFIDLLKKLEKKKTKIKNIIYFIGFLMKTLKNVIEKRYKPDGIHVQECMKKYKNIFSTINNPIL